jgi:hypothetical protein
MKNKSGFATPSAAILAATDLSINEKRQELENFIWETFRDVHGIKPRWYDFRNWGFLALIEEADSLGACVVARIEREKQEARERVRKANAKALAARKFDQKFNSLGNALAGFF